MMSRSGSFEHGNLCERASETSRGVISSTAGDEGDDANDRAIRVNRG